MPTATNVAAERITKKNKTVATLHCVGIVWVMAARSHRAPDLTNGGCQNTTTVPTRATKPNQTASAIHVYAAVLPNFGMGWSRSSMGVALVWMLGAVALTSRSLAQKSALSSQPSALSQNRRQFTAKHAKNAWG